MSIAFVLSGGTSLGAVQVGMAQALDEAGIVPEMIVGTSVGAVNGACLASGHSVEHLAEIWCSLRRRDLFPLRPLCGLLGFLGRRSHLVSNSGLRDLISRNINFDRLENSKIPFSVIAADLRTGHAVRLHRGPAVEAILASAALPGVFPPVQIGERTFIDGGVIDNTPITKAIEAGATEVWVLAPGYSCGVGDPPRGALNLAMHSVAFLVQQRLFLELRHRTYPVPVHLVPPPCPIDISPVDFSQSADLIERSRERAAQWLLEGHPDEALHVHRVIPDYETLSPN